MSDSNGLSPYVSIRDWLEMLLSHRKTIHDTYKAIISEISGFTPEDIEVLKIIAWDRETTEKEKSYLRCKDNRSVKHLDIYYDQLSEL